MALFELVHPSKLISHKIWVTEKCRIFRTVKMELHYFWLLHLTVCIFRLCLVSNTFHQEVLSYAECIWIHSRTKTIIKTDTSFWMHTQAAEICYITHVVVKWTAITVALIRCIRNWYSQMINFSRKYIFMIIPNTIFKFSCTTSKRRTLLLF